MNKLIIFLLILVVITLAVYFVFPNHNKPIKEEPQKQLYQGPVPEGYDEQYFRETGITKPLEDK